MIDRSNGVQRAITFAGNYAPSYGRLGRSVSLLGSTLFFGGEAADYGWLDLSATSTARTGYRGGTYSNLVAAGPGWAILHGVVHKIEPNKLVDTNRIVRGTAAAVSGNRFFIGVPDDEGHPLYGSYRSGSIDVRDFSTADSIFGNSFEP